MFGYQEHDNLEQTINRVEKIGRQLDPDHLQLVVVDDGSTDGSDQLIRRLAATRSHLTEKTHPKNFGIGRALRTGYSACQNELICAIPADGQFDENELLQVPAPQKNQYVSFYRQTRPGYTPMRHFVSEVNKMLMRFLFGVRMRDVNWVKIYRREDVIRAELELTSSLIESELCAKLALLGVECVEHPSRYLERMHGVSRGASLKTIGRAIREIVKLFFVVRRFRRGQPAPLVP